MTTLSEKQAIFKICLHDYDVANNDYYKAMDRGADDTTLDALDVSAKEAYADLLQASLDIKIIPLSDRKRR